MKTNYKSIYKTLTIIISENDPFDMLACSVILQNKNLTHYLIKKNIFSKVKRINDTPDNLYNLLKKFIFLKQKDIIIDLINIPNIVRFIWQNIWNPINPFLDIISELSWKFFNLDVIKLLIKNELFTTALCIILTDESLNNFNKLLDYLQENNKIDIAIECLRSGMNNLSINIMIMTNFLQKLNNHQQVINLLYKNCIITGWTQEKSILLNTYPLYCS